MAAHQSLVLKRPTEAEHRMDREPDCGARWAGGGGRLSYEAPCVEPLLGLPRRRSRPR
jgi:hypothetical protein